MTQSKKEKRVLKAEAREVLGQKVAGLRREGILPGNLFGNGQKSESIQAEKKVVEKLYGETGDTQVVYVSLGEGKESPALFDEIQYAPTKGGMTHFSLKRVNLKEKVTAWVEVKLMGENKVAGAVVVMVNNEIEVEALPTDLPEAFVIDISKLENIDESVSFAQLDYDKEKVKLLINDEDMNKPVVLLEAVKVEEEPAKEEAVEGEEETKAEAEAAPEDAGKEAPAAEEKAE